MGAQERLYSEPNLISRVLRQVEKTWSGLVMSSSSSNRVISDSSGSSSSMDDETFQNLFANHHDLLENHTDLFTNEVTEESRCYAGHFADNDGNLSSSPSFLLSSSTLPTSSVLTHIKRIFRTKSNITVSIYNSTGYGGQQNHLDENPGTVYCNRSFDGLLCWPEIPEGHSVTVSCFGFLNRIAYDTSKTVTRACEEGGIWENKTDYDNCVALGNTPNDTTALDITTWVYFVGYCLSLTTLILAMTIFMAFKELRCVRNTIHTNLMLTYISADALWLITSIQSHLLSSTHASCVTFILLHYFHLTNFFWMFVEGLYLYVLVVQTFTAENIKLRTYLFIGWGLPLLVVIGWSFAKWMTQPGVAQTETPTCLWLTVNPYDWIYKSPAIILLAANSLFLMRIMWVLITKLRSATNPETQQSRKAAKALVVLMPLLGITYVLVLTGSKQPIYEHIRALLISTQGFLVALLYCFLNGEVRQAVRHRWNRISSGPRFERFCRCCCCADFCGRLGQTHNHRDWSLPRSRTESIRLYNCPPTTKCLNNQHTYFNRQRESMTSEITTVTTMTQSNSLQFPPPNGTKSGHGNSYLRPPFMLNVNGTGPGFEPLLSPSLTVSTNLSTVATTTPTPTSVYGHSSQLGIFGHSNSGIPDPLEQDEIEQNDFEEVEFIDSFEGQQEHYGV